MMRHRRLSKRSRRLAGRLEARRSRLVVRRARKSVPPRDPWQLGRDVGFSDGFADGWQFGRYEAARVRLIQPPVPEFAARVLFVRAEAEPYRTLDAGIETALRGLVPEVHTAGTGDDVVAMAEALRPNLLLVLDASGRPFAPEKAEAVRALGIRTAVWFPDDPYHIDRTGPFAPHYDKVFTHESACVPFYQQSGCAAVHHLPFGASPELIHPTRPEPQYRHDICFIGTAYWNRAAFFDQIAGYLSGRDTFINGWWWDRMTQYQTLSGKISGFWLTPEETFRHYTGSKIVINLHRGADDPSHNHNRSHIEALSVNPRLFEISACGTLQLVDSRAELPAHYVPGIELDTFSSPKELVAKIDYYLAHDNIRRETAWRGYMRTLRDHSYRNRLRTLLQLAL